MKLDVKPYEEKMKKSLANLEGEMDLVRAGRANPGILAPVMVEYYGAPTQINQVAEVKVTDARTITITPWESSLLRAIEKAILVADIGINPQNDGKAIRLSFPQPTEERRKELCKQVSKMGEEAKVMMRNIRRDANDKAKDMKKKSEMTEDEQKQSEKAVQDLTDKYIKMVDAVVDKKSKEIMVI
ncbi:MAG: ribosome recycling factor [Ruminococcaceae bacterium]|nr:ribosome recycling factor [Oscillospiraceae bacterium]